MEIFGIAITILSGILTYQAWKNGRWMKQAHEDTQNLMKELHQDTQNLIREMHRNTDETLKEIRRDTGETLKEIAKLIVAEGARTRQLIKA